MGEYCEEERPCLQLRSSIGSSSPSCAHLAAGVHPTAYSPRRRPLRASRDASRKSEHVTAGGLNAATRDMAAIAEAARCAASKCAAKKASHHAPRPFTVTPTEDVKGVLDGHIVFVTHAFDPSTGTARKFTERERRVLGISSSYLGYLPTFLLELIKKGIMFVI